MNNKKSNHILSSNTQGRGFGNLDVSNNMRYGSSSRQNNEDYKEHLESKVTFEYQINHFNNTNDINNFNKNTYVPLFINNNLNLFDRVGESTRKQNQLNINRENIIESKNNIVFNYN